MMFTIEPLTKSHERNVFECGEKSLNLYIRKYAFQNQKRYIGRTYVAVNKKETDLKVCGYYTVSNAELDHISLTAQMRHPRYPVSAARLGRLAVDLKYQKQGLGEDLLNDAILKVARASELLGIFGIVVEAKNERVKGFYERYGFFSLKKDPLLLFLPMSTIMTGLSKVASMKRANA